MAPPPPPPEKKSQIQIDQSPAPKPIQIEKPKDPDPPGPTTKTFSSWGDPHDTDENGQKFDDEGAGEQVTAYSLGGAQAAALDAFLFGADWFKNNPFDDSSKKDDDPKNEAPKVATPKAKIA